jgi:hypothetical protein
LCSFDEWVDIEESGVSSLRTNTSKPEVLVLLSLRDERKNASSQAFLSSLLAGIISIVFVLTARGALMWATASPPGVGTVGGLEGHSSSHISDDKSGVDVRGSA